MMKSVTFAGMMLIGMLAVSSSAQAAPPKQLAWVAGDVTNAVAKHYPIFRKACAQGHIDANCSFLAAEVEYGRQLDDKKRGVMAGQLMQLYVDKGAKRAISLPAAKATRLTAAYAAAKKANNFDSRLFSEAATEITALVVTSINQSHLPAFAMIHNQLLR